MKIDFGAATIETLQGDITLESVDAIVNAANETLLGGGGVDGAIHRAGGATILEECRRLNGCATGDAKMTTAGRMPSRYVIHTVGPIYRSGEHGEAELLASCYRRSLEVAEEAALKSIAFPAIGCGVYGYPIPDAATIAMESARDHMVGGSAITVIRFVLFSAEVCDIFTEALTAINSSSPGEG